MKKNILVLILTVLVGGCNKTPPISPSMAKTQSSSGINILAENNPG